MITDPNETRTTEPEGADDVDTDAEREPGEAGRTVAETENGTDFRKLWLEEGKAAQERANRLERQLAEVMARLGNAPAARDRDDDDPEDVQVRKFADDGDPVAKRQLKQDEKIENLITALVLERQLGKIEDPDLRERTKKHFAKNQHRLGDIDAALAEVEREDDKAEIKRLREGLTKQTRRVDPDIVRTHERDVPATKAKVREVSRADFEAQQKALEWTDPGKFRANQRARRQGLIKIAGED